MQCNGCKNEYERLCVISVFMPGVDDTGITNTVEIARLCNLCLSDYIWGNLHIPQPELAVTIEELLTGVELWGGKK